MKNYCNLLTINSQTKEVILTVYLVKEQNLNNKNILQAPLKKLIHLIKMDSKRQLNLMLLKFQIIMNLCQWIVTQLIAKERDRVVGLARNTLDFSRLLFCMTEIGEQFNLLLKQEHQHNLVLMLKNF